MTLDLVRGRVDLSAGAFRAREEGSGSLLWPHWLAEYGTAAALVVGGAGLLAHLGWGEPVVLLGLGACVYTSTFTTLVGRATGPPRGCSGHHEAPAPGDGPAGLVMDPSRG
ncbi:MAG TPA: hypothetical protein VFR74_08450 [Jiangellales bacterium]|nr:hypothetical protein [Jiangellales bacterium]